MCVLMSIIDIKQNLSLIFSDFSDDSDCVVVFSSVFFDDFCLLHQILSVISVFVDLFEVFSISVCSEELKQMSDDIVKSQALVDHKSSGLHS